MKKLSNQRFKINFKKADTQRQIACGFVMGLTCATVVTGRSVSHWRKSLSPHYPHRHMRSRTHQHAHAMGHGDAQQESILKMSQAHRTVTRNSHIYLQTIPSSRTQNRTWHEHMCICMDRSAIRNSLYVPNTNIYCANKLCALPRHKTLSRYKVNLLP